MAKGFGSPAMSTGDLQEGASGPSEPECLVSPQTRWFRPGFGLICRQVMLPLLGGVLLLAVLTVQILVGKLGLFGLWLPDWVYAGSAMLCILRGMVMIRIALIHPMRQVHDWVAEVSGGNMGAQIDAPGSGDFAGLAADINSLGKRMLEMHESMQEQVSEQTRRLERKTQSLELLYEVVTSSTRFDTVEALLGYFMERFQEVFEAGASVVRVVVRDQLELVSSHGLPPDSPWLAKTVRLRGTRYRRSQVDMQSALDIHGHTDSESGKEEVSTPMNAVTIPIQYLDSCLGSLQLFFGEEETISQENRSLFLSIGQHLGVMIEQSRLDDESERLYMVEARARFANELHDSLAQTLAGLRIQVRVLDETLHQGEEQVTWEELEKLEEQVEGAISELRSLIGQFRAPYQLQDVCSSVGKLVERCQQDTNLDVFFQNQWQDDDLTPGMRIDVIRIVQEALNNARKHAEASNVRVLLRNRAGTYRVVVEDDGIGYDEKSLSENENLSKHIGLQIMAERAARLGAEFKCESEPGEGSRVFLEFKHLQGRGPGEPEDGLRHVER